MNLCSWGFSCVVSGSHEVPMTIEKDWLDGSYYGLIGEQVSKALLMEKIK